MMDNLEVKSHWTLDKLWWTLFSRGMLNVKKMMQSNESLQLQSEGKYTEEGFLAKSMGGNAGFKCILLSYWMWPVWEFLAFPCTFFMLLFFILVVSNYWKSALILVRTWLLEVCLETESARGRWDGFGGGECSRMSSVMSVSGHIVLLLQLQTDGLLHLS